MKKYIILSGSLLLIVVMLLTPSISAMEYKTIKDKIQSDYTVKLEGIRQNIEELKTLGKNVNINLRLILMILIRGIILPVIGLIVSEFVGRIVQENISKGMAIIIVCIIQGLTIGSTLIPIWNKIEELTGSFLLGLLVYTLLAFIDLILAYGIIYIIDTISNNRGATTSSISGLKNSVKSLLNVV